MTTSCGLFYWEEATGVLYNYDGTYPVRVTLAEFGEEDQIALKSEIDGLKTRIENLVTENTNLKATIEAMESRLTALENILTRINYTFSVPNSSSIRYQFEKPFDAYEGTLYLKYHENKNNVTSEKEIKINISFNVNNTPTYEFQCEPNKIWLNNIEFPLNSSNLMVNATANFILINTTFFTSNGILTEDNTKNEIHSLR